MMKRDFYPLLTVAFAIAGAVLLYAHPAFAAFGISPPFLNADHLVPGVTYSQTLYLVRDDASAGLPIVENLSVSDDIKSWITIDEPTNFVIPTDTKQFPVTITIKVPSGASNGKYSGALSFTTVPNQSGQVSVAIGVNVSLNLTVGNDVFEQFTVPVINVIDIEEGWNPKVYIKLANTGNVPESFDSATFELFDQYDATRLAYLQKQGGFPSTPAFTTNDYTVDFPSDFHLGIGSYWGNVTFYQNGKAVASQKMSFRVLPAGTLTGWVGKLSFYVTTYLWQILLVLAAIGAVISFIVRRRRHGRVPRA